MTWLCPWPVFSKTGLWVMTYLCSGLRSRSRDWSWSRLESTVLAGVGVGAGVGKIWPTPTPARSRSLPLGNRRWFWPNVYTSYENIESQDKKESSSVQLKPKRYLVIKFRLIKASELILGPSQSFVTVPTHSKTGMTTTVKGINDTHHRLHPQLARMKNVLVCHPFGYNQNWNQEYNCIRLLFLTITWLRGGGGD